MFRTVFVSSEPEQHVTEARKDKAVQLKEDVIVLGWMDRCPLRICVPFSLERKYTGGRDCWSTLGSA